LAHAGLAANPTHHLRRTEGAFPIPTALKILPNLVLAVRQARTARMRRARVDFFRKPNSGTPRLIAGVSDGGSVNPKNLTM
jgi:hypothetical protein